MTYKNPAWRKKRPRAHIPRRRLGKSPCSRPPHAPGCPPRPGASRGTPRGRRTARAGAARVRRRPHAGAPPPPPPPHLPARRRANAHPRSLPSLPRARPPQLRAGVGAQEAHGPGCAAHQGARGAQDGEGRRQDQAVRAPPPLPPLPWTQWRAAVCSCGIGALLLPAAAALGGGVAGRRVFRGLGWGAATPSTPYDTAPPPRRVQASPPGGGSWRRIGVGWPARRAVAAWRRRPPDSSVSVWMRERAGRRLAACHGRARRQPSASRRAARWHVWRGA